MELKYEMFPVKDPTRIGPRFSSEPLFQIRSLKPISLRASVVVPAGAFGGYVSNENNLSQSGSCWIGPGSSALDGSRVEGDAVLIGASSAQHESRVNGSAFLHDTVVCEEGVVTDRVEAVQGSHIGGRAIARKEAKLMGATLVGDSQASDMVRIEFSTLEDMAMLQDYAAATNGSMVSQGGVICEEGLLDDSTVTEQGKVGGRSKVCNKSTIRGRSEITDEVVVDDSTISNDVLVAGNQSVIGKKIKRQSSLKGPENSRENTRDELISQGEHNELDDTEHIEDNSEEDSELYGSQPMEFSAAGPQNIESLGGKVVCGADLEDRQGTCTNKVHPWTVKCQAGHTVKGKG